MPTSRSDFGDPSMSRCLHDLRNALNRIALSVECLRRHENEEGARFVAAIERALGEAGLQLDRLQGLKAMEQANGER